MFFAVLCLCVVVFYRFCCAPSICWHEWSGILNKTPGRRPNNEIKSIHILCARMQIAAAFQLNICTTNWFVSIHTNNNEKKSDKIYRYLESAFVRRTDILIAIGSAWIGELTYKSPFHAVHTHDKHGRPKNAPTFLHIFSFARERKSAADSKTKKKPKPKQNGSRRNFRVGLITAHEIRKNKSNNQSSRKSIPLHLIYANWNEKKRSNQVGNSFLFERLTICIFLLKIFDCVTVENILKAALHLLQFIMFRPINSTICKIF